MRAWPALLAAFVLAAADGALGQKDEPLTPDQEQVLKRVRAIALGASLQAEGDVIDELDDTSFLEPDAANEFSGAPAELLQRVKENLDCLEWTHNFGLDVTSQHLEPGGLVVNTAAIEQFGHIPSGWELKAAGSPLVANLSQKEWGVMDAAETGLYKLPSFTQPENPSVEEARGRPVYFAGNLRRLDTAMERYGPLAAVLRNGVAAKRALLTGSDTGGWTSGCNRSVVPVTRPNWIQRLLFRCDPVGTTPLGVAANQVHTLLSNGRTFSRAGGSLSRMVEQLLVPGAPVRPIENIMYTEAAVLGPVRTSDWKLLVASFASHFGTSEGQELRSFCARHGLPLAWALGSARAIPEAASMWLMMPFEAFEFWPAGRARLLDPWVGWNATNISRPGVAAEETTWSLLWDDVAAARAAAKPAPSRDSFKEWWEVLAQVSPAVPPLRGRDCASADLCFGTVAVGGTREGGASDCVCRKPPDGHASATPAAQRAAPLGEVAPLSV